MSRFQYGAIDGSRSNVVNSAVVSKSDRSWCDSPFPCLQFMRVRSTFVNYSDVQAKMQSGAKDVDLSPFNVTDRSAAADSCLKNNLSRKPVVLGSLIERKRERRNQGISRLIPKL